MSSFIKYFESINLVIKASVCKELETYCKNLEKRKVKINGQRLKAVLMKDK